MKKKDCTAHVCHGPGHQSTTHCYLTKKYHKIHETRYGSYELLIRWKGQEVFTDYFDNPKNI